MKLSIIIPVYNEEQTIREVVERVRAVDIGAIEKEIIIANDGSSDGTRLSIDSSEWISDPRVKIYDNPINVGKGGAVRIGLKYATGDIILIQDADLELDPGGIQRTAGADSRRPHRRRLRLAVPPADGADRAAHAHRQPRAHDCHQRAVRRPPHRHGDGLQSVPP